MQEQAIKPERITKPIQVLGAWLAGLFSINSCFLFAAANMGTGSWEAMALVIAAILNVPIFLAAVFLLQTKFRPELQEDSYYSTYLNSKTNELVKVDKLDVQFAEIRQRIAELDVRTLQALPRTAEDVTSQFAKLRIGVNRHLPDTSKIRAALRENGVVGTSVFGADNPPPHRVVAISQYLARSTQQEVAQMAEKLGFQSYSIFDKEAERTEEDILFGAYGDPEFQITSVA